MKTLTELFKQHARIEAPEGLNERVLFRVDAEIKRVERREHIAWGVIFLTSLSIFIASGIHTAGVIASSNFGSYISIIFSDGSTAVTLWKQILLSLAESFPFIEVSLFLGSIVAVLWSIRNFSKNGFFINPSRAHVA